VGGVLGGRGGTGLKQVVGTFAKVVSPSTPPPHTHVLAHPQQPTMPKKGGKYTTMTDEVCIALCNHKKRNPTLSQAELQH